jgi:hypothetical protein
MYHFDSLHLPPDNSLHVHQTRHIHGRDDFGAIPLMISDPVFPHLYGYFRLKVIFYYLFPIA